MSRSRGVECPDLVVSVECPDLVVSVECPDLVNFVVDVWLSTSRKLQLYVKSDTVTPIITENY